MKENTKRFIKGAGSILDLYPSVKLDNFDIPKRTTNQQIEKAWDMVGVAFRKAVNDFVEESNNKKQINI